MPRKYARRGIAIVAVGAMGAAGCGESQEFIHDYNRAVKPIIRIADGPPLDGDARDFERGARDLRAVGDSLDKLDAPTEATQPLVRLRVAVRAGAAQLLRLRDAVEKRDASLLAKESRRWARVGAELVRAEGALKAAVE